MPDNLMLNKSFLFCAIMFVCGYYLLPWPAWKGSNTERINIAVNEFINDPEMQQRLMRTALLEELREWIDPDLFKYELSGSRTQSEFAANVEFIPWQTQEELMTMNPDCCTVKLAPNNESCETNIRNAGINRNKNCVYINYFIRYKDDDGNIRLRKSYNRERPRYFAGTNFIRAAALIDDEDNILEWTTKFFIN